MDGKGFFEFIKYKKDLRGSGDFNGAESSLSLDEQIEFLDKYGKAYKEFSGFNPQKKVADLKEAEEYVDKIPYPENKFRNAVELSKAEFYISDERKYKYLYTYTPKAVVSGESVILNSGDIPPVPAFDVETEKRISKFTARFKISGDYEISLRGRIDTMSVGKTIELRDGINEIVKIQLYPSGDVLVRLNFPDEYHHRNFPIGKFAFDTDNVLSVRIDNGGFYVRLNDGEETRFERDIKVLPDVLFVGGGMHAMGTWSVTPRIFSENGEELDIFAPNTEPVAVERIGLKKLPFCVGTFKNRRKTLILEKKFDYKRAGVETYIIFDTLDPCGEAVLNGKTLFRDGTFMSHRINVTGIIKERGNSLKVKIYPRAPENTVTWHRQKDPYYGWFTGKIKIESVNHVYVERIKIKTVSVSPVINFRTEISASDGFVYSRAEVFVSDGEKTFKAGEGKGNVACSFSGKPWSTESPVLYSVTVKLYVGNILTDEFTEITGFRTIEQKDGALALNGKDFVLKGALLMQYLPPYDETPVNHVCPSDAQIIWQALLAKRMNCNAVRMHHLGYGTNDSRFARIFDYFGLTVIWTTRLIDDVYGTVQSGVWRGKKSYQSQMLEVINSPSIIAWEGANEVYLFRKDIDAIYGEFVGGVREIDETRLINPVSHLYYANDSYDVGAEYYQDDGKSDEYFKPCRAVSEWNDPLVIRSAHTYIWLLGYGTDWSRMRKQSWSAQPAMLNSDKHAYVVSEYALIGRQNPNIPEAKDFYNPWSYEFSDEYALGYRLDDKWLISQSYQALGAKYASKRMLSLGADGLLWCSLSSGANDGGYLKPPIDYYGYPKLAFYALKESFSESVCFSDDTDVVWGADKKIAPVVVCVPDGKKHSVAVTVKNDSDMEIFKTRIENILFDRRIIKLESLSVKFPQDGYYKIIYAIDED